MHALFVMAEIEPIRLAEADAMLKNGLAPQIRQTPGFVSGTWARSPDGKDARSLVVFETEEAARTALASLNEGMPADAPAKIISASVLEIVLQV